MAGRTLHENNAVRVIGTPAAWAAEAAYGTWVNMLGYRRALFIAQNGELDGNMLVKPYMATDADGTDATAITTTAAGASVNGSFVNGTDEARAGLIEIRDADLDDGYSFITLQVTPAAADTYSAVVVLSEPYEAPPTNGTADAIAFVKGD